MRAVGARADVVAGGQSVGAEVLRGGQKVGKLDRLVAGNAGNRRFAGDIALGEGIDDRLAEALFIVEHVMGDAERIRDATRPLTVCVSSNVIDVIAGLSFGRIVDVTGCVPALSLCGFPRRQLTAITAMKAMKTRGSATRRMRIVRCTGRVTCCG